MKIDKCTCENPGDNLCDFCDERQNQEILKNAEQECKDLIAKEKLVVTLARLILFPKSTYTDKDIMDFIKKAIEHY